MFLADSPATAVRLELDARHAEEKAAVRAEIDRDTTSIDNVHQVRVGPGDVFVQKDVVVKVRSDSTAFAHGEPTEGARLEIEHLHGSYAEAWGPEVWPVTVDVTGEPLFADGFESGDTAAW